MTEISIFTRNYRGLSAYILVSCLTIFGGAFLNPLRANGSASQPLCASQVFSKVKLIEFEQDPSPMVCQVEGSCYFEAAVAFMETRLSRRFGQPLAISRIHLMSHLLQQRFEQLIDQPRRLNQLYRNAKSSISGGFSQEVIDTANGVGLLVYHRQHRTATHLKIESDEVSGIVSSTDAFLGKYKRGDIERDMLVKEVSQGLQSARSRSLTAISNLNSFTHQGSSLIPVFFSPLFGTELTKKAIGGPRAVERFQEFLRRSADNDLAWLASISALESDDKDNQGEWLPTSSSELWDAVKVLFLGSAHSMLVVGYIENGEGRITHALLRNSHGDKGFDGGYTTMGVDTLFRRLREIEAFKLIIKEAGP